MKIAVVTEVSTKHRNDAILEALQDCGHEVFNVAMTSGENESEFSYIHTSFMAAFLLDIGAVDFVIGGCGTGQGFNIAANMYPNIYCGLLYDPLEAWLFPQINHGNVVSIPLNKQYGWAGEQNLKMIFNALFSATAGGGFPPERKIPQKLFREELKNISIATHKNGLDQIMMHINPEVFIECAKSKIFMELVNKTKTLKPSKELFIKLISF